MSDPVKPRMTVGRTLGRFAAAYALLVAMIPVGMLGERAHAAWWVGYGAWPDAASLPVSIPQAIAHRLVDLFVFHAMPGVILSLAFTLFVATFAVPLGAIARKAARQRVVAGRTDPLERARQWTLAHPTWTRALTVLPALLVAAFASKVSYSAMFGNNTDEILGTGPIWGIATVLSTVALTALLRRGLKALLAPVAAADVAQVPLDSSEITFDAVAVTGESIAAVAAMVALTIAVVAVPLAVNLPRSDWVGVAVAAYVGIALGGAWLFRHASKIRVGVDGVFVSGTSRTRFFAYRDLDDARVDTNDLVLVRGGKNVLRLQLHGEHATRRDAIGERIRDAIARTRRSEGARAAHVATTASPAELARVVSGGAGYRAASVTRDDLWDLVEGPTVDAATRAAAAQALAKSGSDASSRIRIAAGACADPKARAALEALADEESDELGIEGQREPARFAIR